VLAKRVFPSDTHQQISVFFQVPIYSMIGLSELLAMLSGMEYAYTKAPQSMRSIIMSLFLLTGAVGSSLGITLSPVSVNPKIFIEYVSLSATMFVTAIVFFFCFRKYNRIEEGMNMLVKEDSSRDSWYTEDTGSSLEKQ
jgi:POT family proton-dependent oligopeptide transporter